MANRTMASALTVAALIACAIPVQARISLFTSIVGQVAPSFSVPETVPQGTQVRVSSSAGNMNAISEALGKEFEGEYANSTVLVTSKDADAAIQDILNDTADLAAISRPLTDEEKAKGLVSIPVLREKIAIVVGVNNPFSQSLSSSQFAQIFRGEIKDWSSVGGAAGPIRVIDRSASNETRLALKPYPVFATADFETSDNATQLSEDSIEALAQALGTDGIGYALIGQIEGLSNIKTIELHKTPPTDPRYPFSQPYAFVYNGGASPAATAFLGYATGKPGQTVLQSIDINSHSILSNGVTGNAVAAANAGIVSSSETDTSYSAANDSNPNDITTQGNPDRTIEANGTTHLDPTHNSSPTHSGTGGTNGTNGASVGSEGNGSPINSTRTPSAIDGAAENGAPGTAVGTATISGTGITSENERNAEIAAGVDGDAVNSTGEIAASQGRWWWLLLPLAGLGILIWAAGRRSSEEETGYIANADNDDRIRSDAFRSSDLLPGKQLDSGEGSLGASTEPADIGSTNIASTGIGKVVAGSNALASSVAIAEEGLTGRVKDRPGDITMDLNSIPGNDVAGNDVAGNGVSDNVQNSTHEIQSINQSTLDRSFSAIQENDPDSWLAKAKQRINEAAEQIKDSTAELKSDITQD